VVANNDDPPTVLHNSCTHDNHFKFLSCWNEEQSRRRARVRPPPENFAPGTPRAAVTSPKAISEPTLVSGVPRRHRLWK
jgi:hypothetical protein